MTALALRRRPRRWLASMVLFAFVMRAWIPVGFMPAAGVPGLMPCHAGQTAGADGEPAHKGSGHIEQCPFGSAPGAAPLSTHAILIAHHVTAPGYAARPTSDAAAERPATRAHGSRAPPVLS